jgi:hypothetical protein
MNRRVFFGTLGFSRVDPAACVSASLRRAQPILFAGGIGRIAYCRAATEEWLRLAREICPEPTLIAEVDPAGVPARSGVVFLGSEATLVVGHGEWRVAP